jgi:hypothetical protein
MRVPERHGFPNLILGSIEIPGKISIATSPHQRNLLGSVRFGSCPRILDDLLVLVVGEVILGEEVFGDSLRVQIHFLCIQTSLQVTSLHLAHFSVLL